MKTYKVIAIDYGEIVGTVGIRLTYDEAKNLIKRIKDDKTNYNFIPVKREYIYELIEELRQ